jgi:diguanylate cyclase (GGDEF)-like protein
LLVLSLSTFSIQQEEEFSLLRVLSFSGWVGATMLFWTGDRRFQLQRTGKRIWLIAGVVVSIYLLLELNRMPHHMRPVALAVWSILFWNFALYKVFAGTKIRFTLSTCLLIAGVCMLSANSVFRILAAFQLLPLPAGVAQDASYRAARFLGTLTGGILMGTSCVLRYFERVVHESNRAATHDELTGLLNRRALVANGEREIEVARRSCQPLAVAFVDIDFFKKINDQYGHDQGDLALREVAQVLRQNCRSIDLLGRYGGEEFCLIFPGDDHAGAMIVGERLLAAVRDDRISGLPQVTISIGLAVLDPRDVSQTWHGLVNLADVELYKAKHGGRDRYSIAPTITRDDEAHRQIPPAMLVTAG